MHVRAADALGGYPVEGAVHAVGHVVRGELRRHVLHEHVRVACGHVGVGNRVPVGVAEERLDDAQDAGGRLAVPVHRLHGPERHHLLAARAAVALAERRDLDRVVEQAARRVAVDGVDVEGRDLRALHRARDELLVQAPARRRERGRAARVVGVDAARDAEQGHVLAHDELVVDLEHQRVDEHAAAPLAADVAVRAVVKGPAAPGARQEPGPAQPREALGVQHRVHAERERGVALRALGQDAVHGLLEGEQ
mmetsp:Transcript_44093/g.125792  ORF Transcript_44093/g.125792 Transcript_44093/m.125792 type:complete len:251 (-) Transcript_44093:1430-2182(-)